MLHFTNPEMNSTKAKRRGPVPVPAPLAGASKPLRDEFELLRSRTEALEADRKLAALHREAFDRELEETTDNIGAIGNDSKGQPVAVEEDCSVVWGANEVRDIAIGLLRKELAIRSDLVGYLKNWQTEARKAIVAMRSSVEETRSGVMEWLIKGDAKHGGFDDPRTRKFSPSRVLPGYINDHPAVRAATEELRAAEAHARKSKSGPENAREIEELRQLIRNEASRLAGLSVG